jgi:hypothetical protein
VACPWLTEQLSRPLIPKEDWRLGPTGCQNARCSNPHIKQQSIGARSAQTSHASR